MKRVTSFILALLIFASALASAIFVLQAIRQEQSDEASVATTGGQLADQTNQQTEETEPVNENALKGKALANFTPTAERLTAVKTEDVTVGTGAEITSVTQTVTAHYTGARAIDGVVFESSKDSGKEFTAPLSNLIKGWQTGMLGMKAGGVRRLTIPAAEAYGDDESTGRPTGDLVFDIELSNVQ
jgi:FKBP-type peptidyl-prolyl cis-trans isomerase